MNSVREQGSFDPAIKRLLCQLADPQVQALFANQYDGIELRPLFQSMRHHGIEAIAVPKLGASLPKNGLSEMLMEQEKEYQFVANAHSLILEAHADRIINALKRAELHAVIVKGPVFSKELYEREADRQYTDIDILSHPTSIGDIGEILRQEGFHQAVREFWDNSERNMEQKWVHNDNANILVELHGNLVHYAGLRRRISFSYEDYQTASCNGKCPAIAYFITAVVHAAAGHKFHRLALLVDVLQALRRLEDNDLARLGQVVDMLGLRLEVLTCLDLVGSLFGEVNTRPALAHLPDGRNYSWTRRLVTADAVLDTWRDTGHRSRLRRHAFRWMQHIVPRR